MSEPYAPPMVSLVIPCRNEEETIGRVIQSLLRQDYQYDRMELLFVDGMSTDNTRHVIEQYARTRPSLDFRIIANPQRIAAAGFNAGIAAARGDVVCTLGAHTEYSPNYVSRMVATMQETGADAVGSVAETVPGEDSKTARAIAVALASRFGVGNSLMRVGVARPQEADTASCPGYRRAVFARVGLFNTGLVRNQDIEFNLRLRRAGGRIVLDPGITTFYRARSRLRDVVRNSFQNGYWVVRAVRVARLPFSLRHLVPLAFVASLLSSAVAAAVWSPAAAVLATLAGCYAAADFLYAARAVGGPDFTTKTQRLRELNGRRQTDQRTDGGIRLLVPLLAAFPTLHIPYGLGSLWALLTIWWPGRRAARSAKPGVHSVQAEA